MEYETLHELLLIEVFVFLGRSRSRSRHACPERNETTCYRIILLYSCTEFIVKYYFGCLLI